MRCQVSYSRLQTYGWGRWWSSCPEQGCRHPCGVRQCWRHQPAVSVRLHACGTSWFGPYGTQCTAHSVHSIASHVPAQRIHALAYSSSASASATQVCGAQPKLEAVPSLSGLHMYRYLSCPKVFTESCNTSNQIAAHIATQTPVRRRCTLYGCHLPVPFVGVSSSLGRMPRPPDFLPPCRLRLRPRPWTLLLPHSSSLLVAPDRAALLLLLPPPPLLLLPGPQGLSSQEQLPVLLLLLPSAAALAAVLPHTGR